MDSAINRQTLALAGVFQAAKLVDRLAKSGMIDIQQIESAVESVLNLNPTSYEDVFKGKENVSIGLNTLKEAMAKNGRSVNREVLQYAMGILAVQNKLQKRPDLMESLSNALDRTVDQQKYFNSFSHEAVIASTAQCYENSISKLNFRIRVTGNPTHLQNPKIAEKVRTILLFGVRCAMLWRQAGGHRWHFLTSRKAIKDCADGLLSVV
jgi:high frequency lysogenization protein